MLRLIGLIVVVGAVFIFLNWNDYRDHVSSTVNKIDDVAEQAEQMHENLNKKVEQIKEKLDD